MGPGAYSFLPKGGLPDPPRPKRAAGEEGGAVVIGCEHEWRALSAAELEELLRKLPPVRVLRFVGAFQSMSSTW